MDLNKLPFHSNILLISGNGKNVGKTTLSCAIIKHFALLDIVGVKISPHFHEFDSEIEDVIFRKEGIIIIEEHRKNTGKDSSRLKETGAYRVFFIMVQDDNLQEAFDKLIEIVGTNNPMIIESAALRSIIIPSQFLLLSHVDRPDPKKSIKHLLAYVDHNITLFHNHLDFTPENIACENFRWSLFL